MRFKTTATLGLLLFAPMLAALMGTGASADEAEWTLLAKTQVRTASKPDTELCQLADKLRIDVSSFKNGAEKEQKPFEKLWYNNGKAVGLERNTALAIPSQQAVRIEIEGSPAPSLMEERACADAILRLVLSLLLNQNQVKNVVVPDVCFSTILQELNCRNGKMLAQGEQPPAEAKVVLNLESHSGLRQTVYFI